MKWHERSANMMAEAWETYLQNLKQSLDQLEADIDEAASMKDGCTDEWCQATEHVLDELHKSVFSIHEPTFTSSDVSNQLKDLRKRLHAVYSKYLQAA